MIDTIAAIRSAFLADAGITALVGTRIYGAPPGLPEGQPSPPPASIVIQAVGGDVAASDPTLQQRYYVRCYGATGQDTMALYRALYDSVIDTDGRLRGPRLISGRWLLKSATLTAPATDEEPQGWPITTTTLTTRFDALRGAAG